MSKKRRNSTPPSPEDLGIPPQPNGVMGINAAGTGMYREMADRGHKHNLAIRIFSALIAFIALVLPGIFLIVLPFGWSSGFSPSSVISLVFGIVLIAAGTAIIYANVWRGRKRRER